MVDFNTLMAMTPEERARFNEELAEKRGRRNAAGPSDEKPVSRALVEKIIKRRAREAHPELTEEVAIGRFARTPEGRGWKVLYDNLPEDRLLPRPPSGVQKANPGASSDARRELQQKAEEYVSKNAGTNPEVAFAKVSRLPENEELVKRYRAQEFEEEA